MKFDPGDIESLYIDAGRKAWEGSGVLDSRDPEAIMLAVFAYGLARASESSIRNMAALCSAELTARGVAA